MAEKNNRRGPRANYEDVTGGGKVLAEAIKETSQAKAAEDLGITPAFLNHLIHGRKTPGLALARKIRDRFGVSVDVW